MVGISGEAAICSAEGLITLMMGMISHADFRGDCAAAGRP